MDPNEKFELVPLRRGGVGIRSERYGEICHPGVGPREEAEQVYVGALELRRRWMTEPGEFVLWDVGLGGAANATAVIQAASAIDCSLSIVSFDWGTEPLRFALRHARELGYFGELEGWCQILAEQGNARFDVGRAKVRWAMVAGDFTERMKGKPGEATGVGLGPGVELPAPHAILYDPHSPSANPEMWTLPLFEALLGRLDPNRLCGLATYSRSTAVRVALLLAGFWVGAGAGTATKEETTVASNRREGVAVPLDGRWLERVRRSGAAEPWDRPPFEGRPLAEATWARLCAHPQFVGEARGRSGNGALPTVGLDAL
jgi:tRNA U34 5-methylaminomethyl-2-thiouridine-forming methyltransferase MnmC